MTRSSSTWRTLIGIAVIAALAYSAGYLASSRQQVAVFPPTSAGFIWPPPPPLEPFTLTDTDDRTFDQTRFSDRWTLVFFGYTHCPDICPTTMQILGEIHQRLGGHDLYVQRGQVLFISVDEQRDTPEQLRRYTDHFSPDFLAATGPAEELHRITGQFGVQIVRVSGSSPDEYWYDHPSSILLIGPDQKLAGVFVPPLDAEDIAAQVQAIVDWADRRG
ncbi:MAG: SCO family protein [Gammaproteobacteria bacterium]